MSEVYEPHPKQRAVMLCPANEILYGGSAGSGKSFCIIFSWMQHHTTYRKNAKGLVLRKTMAELEDLIREFQKVFSVLQQPPKWNETKKTFFYQDGATLELGYLDKEDDKYRYHGRQFTFIAWDELTLWRTDDAYRFLLTRLRSAEKVAVTVLSTTNPIGVGSSWVKKRWKIDQYPEGMEPFTQYINLKTGDISDGTPELKALSDVMLINEGYKRWTRIFIPGRLSDNPTLDAGGAYRASLMLQPEKIRKALLDGQWDAIEGQFFHEWDPKVHVVPYFKPPEGFRRWMAMDWGTAKPYCCLWATEMPDGSVVVYDELYGQHPSGDSDRGTMENATQVAQKIRERERLRGDFITERYADPSIFSDHGNIMSIEMLFRKEGVVFQAGGRRDKEARIALLRQYMSVTNGITRLKIMNVCRNLVRTIPEMLFSESNPEQYDSKLEDHCIAEGTGVVTDSGVVPIEKIGNEHRVWTPVGWKQAHKAKNMGTRNTVLVQLSNGSSVRATEDHKFLVAGKGFRELTDVCIGDILVVGGDKYGPYRFDGQEAAFQWKSLLPVREILSKEGKEATSGSLPLPPRRDPEEASCSPQEWRQVGQSPTEYGIDEWARSLVIAHDFGTEGVGQNPYPKDIPAFCGVAPERRGARMAPGTRPGVVSGVMGEDAEPSGSSVCLHDVPWDGIREVQGCILLRSLLPDSGAQTRHYGAFVENIGSEADSVVYDIGVDESHCFMLWNGVFAHNCVDCLLYLLGKNISVVRGKDKTNGLNTANISRYSGMGVW